MAQKGHNIGLVLALVSMMWHGAWAQSTCMNALMSMAPCANFLTGSLSGPPSTSCCSQLNWMVQNQPQCLCSLINGGGPFLGMIPNQTMALALPGACSLQTPSVDQCSTVTSGPTASTASPESAPVEVPESTPPSSSSSDTPNNTNKTPTTPPSETKTPSSAGAGSKTVPSTNSSSSSARTTISPFAIATLILLTISFI